MKKTKIAVDLIKLTFVIMTTTTTAIQ